MTPPYPIFLKGKKKTPFIIKEVSFEIKEGFPVQGMFRSAMGANLDRHHNGEGVSFI
jgi:hypothetical protein